MARLSEEIFCQLFLFMRLMFALPIDTTHDVIRFKQAAGNASRSHDCGVTALASPELNLSSPGYPDHLPHDFYLCEWILQGLYSHQVRVTFLTFDLPNPDHEGHCDAAFINYGGYDHQGRRVAEGKRCGADCPEPFYASTRGAWVELVITGVAPPSIYNKCKGLLIHYQLDKTGLKDSMIFIIILLGIMLPALCCCPMVWFLRNRKQSKNTEYLTHMRAEARRQKLEVKAYLDRSIALATKQQEQNETVKVADAEVGAKQSSEAHHRRSCEGTSTSTMHPSPLCPTSGNHGNISQHHLTSSTPHTQVNVAQRSFEPINSPRSGYGWVKVTPIAVHSSDFGLQIIEHKTALQFSHRKRLRKLSLAFSAPSLGSICELEEMHHRCDSDLEACRGVEDQTSELSDKEISDTEESKMQEDEADANEDEVFL